MTDDPRPAESPLPESMARAARAIRELSRQNAELRASLREPVAIVGMACRFPGGASSPEEYWRLLAEGRDGTADVPPERWDAAALFDPDPDAPGRMYTTRGGFLRDPVDRFDADFFGISRREATAMDPQQRLLLEMAWEAIEDSGTAPGSLMDSRTGVFVGISTSDYMALGAEQGAVRQIDAYAGTGNSFSAAAGRISHTLGLTGPCLPVDTACSSSLVAVSLAVQALRSGQCDAALVGGVNLMLAPGTSIAMCRLRALSPSGRCSSFAAEADGYVRGEGGGVIFLKRLRDAQADGDRIRAVIRGSAINHDGRSGGFTVPNPAAQRAVIRAALDDAALDPVDVDLVEAHGTGTALGDPIEMRALAEVFCPGPGRAFPLVVGSVKTNVGHLEAAAGMAGLQKLVLALEHGEIPRNLHFAHPSPHIPWDSLSVSVPTRHEPWPGVDRAKRAGMNVFGMTGTNAHLILEEAPPGSAPASFRQEETDGPHLLPLSARTAPALRELAGRLADRLASGPDALEDFCFTAAVGRTHFEHRTFVVARTAGEFVSRLRAIEQGEIPEPEKLDGAPRVVFVFRGCGDGQGGEVMQALYDAEVVVREVLDTCNAKAGVDPVPGLYAVGCAMDRLWRSWGLAPDLVVGHGTGELAAAFSAGSIGLLEGLEVAAGVGRLAGHGLAGRGNGAPLPQVGWRPPTTRLVSATTGRPLDVRELADPEHWRERTGSPTDAGETLPLHGEWRDALVIEMRPAGREAILTALGEAYAAGATIDWPAVPAASPRRKIGLPTYPFQRQRHWAYPDAGVPFDPGGPFDAAASPATDTLDGFEVLGNAPREERAAALLTYLRERAAHVLQTDPGLIATDRSVVEVGLDSIMIMELRSVLTRDLRIEISHVDLFEQPSLQALAAFILDALEDAPARRVPLPPIRASETDTPAPASVAQERLLILDRLDPGQRAYNIPVTLRLRGPLDAEGLRRSLEKIVRRHDALRTVFEFTDDLPIQRVRPFSGFDLPLEDVAALPPEDREAAARSVASAFQGSPFDLERDPLLRAQLIRIQPADHLLVVVMHHIVSDGVSVAVFLRELLAGYPTAPGEEAPRLPPLPVQYSDYARWQREEFTVAALEPELAYWTRRLEKLEPLCFPTDRPRPVGWTHEGGRVIVELPEAMQRRLEQACAREGVTPFMMLLAAFKVVLSRYSGQQDIVVGSPTAGRTVPEVQELIGCFINPLVLRTRVTPDASFRDLLGRVRSTALEAHAHQQMPFEQLVRVLNPVRDPSRSPLFQIMFNVLPRDRSPHHQLDGIYIERIPPEAPSVRFDLELDVVQDARGTSLCWTFATDLFDAPTIERLSRHYVNVLETALRDPETPVERMPLLGEAERSTIVSRWNDTAVERGPDSCVHQLFEAQVDATPMRVAVENPLDSRSYAELEGQANQLAHFLRSMGVARGARVAICTDRSPDLVVALLGVLKAGAAYIPLDPDLPRSRLAALLQDSGAEVLVSQRSLSSRLPADFPRAVWLDAERSGIESFPRSRPLIGSSPDDLAYLIYTSGSTGKPKGVQVSHRSVVNLLRSMAVEPGFTRDDTLLSTTTLGFDISALELLLPLATGGRTFLVDPETARDGRKLAQSLERSGATVMQATPSGWRLLVDSGWKGCNGLRMLAGGEPLPLDLARALLVRGSELWNVYGPTETTIWSTIHRVQPTDDRILIGHPIDNTVVVVLDRAGEPVPIGVAGELWISGHGVARGYLDQPELTAERFVERDIDGLGRRVFYRTGDLARWTAAGHLEHLGRTDDQVKIRGFRIEPGEVEAALLAHPSVGVAVVLPAASGNGQGGTGAFDHLEAFVIAHAGARVETGALRDHLAGLLPPYMVPSRLALVPEFPRTPNGKLDRKRLLALAEPSVAGEARVPGAGEPSTETEILLAGIWRELLGVERVGLEDNFFDLGGHSMLAVRLVTRVEQATGVQVGARELTLQTLRQMAASCDARTSRPPPPLPPSLLRRIVNRIRSLA